MSIIVMALIFTLIIAAVLWRTGATQIPKEMRQSFSPQDLETMQEELNFRKLVGQLLAIAVTSVVLVWLIW